MSKTLISEADILGNTVFQDSIAKYQTIQSSLSTLYQTAENTSISAIETLSKDIASISKTMAFNSTEQIPIPNQGFCNSVLLRIILKPTGSSALNIYAHQGWGMKVAKDYSVKIGSTTCSIISPPLLFVALMSDCQVKEKKDKLLKLLGEEHRGDTLLTTDELIAYVPLELPWTSMSGTLFHKKPISASMFNDTPYIEITTNDIKEILFGAQAEIDKFVNVRIDFLFRMTQPVDQGVLVQNQLIKQINASGIYKTLNYFYDDYVMRVVNSVPLIRSGTNAYYEPANVDFDFKIVADIYEMYILVYPQLSGTGTYFLNQPLDVMACTIKAYTGDNKYIQQKLSHVPSRLDLTLGDDAFTTRVYDDFSIFDSTVSTPYPYVSSPFLSTEEEKNIPCWSVSMYNPVESDEIQNVPLLPTQNTSVEFTIPYKSYMPTEMKAKVFVVCKILKDMNVSPNGAVAVAT